MAQDEFGNMATDYCPIACRYFNIYTMARFKNECEETLCTEGVEYPIGTVSVMAELNSRD